MHGQQTLECPKITITSLQKRVRVGRGVASFSTLPAFPPSERATWVPPHFASLRKWLLYKWDFKLSPPSFPPNTSSHVFCREEKEERKKRSHGRRATWTPPEAKRKECEGIIPNSGETRKISGWGDSSTSPSFPHNIFLPGDAATSAHLPEQKSIGFLKKVDQCFLCCFHGWVLLQWWTTPSFLTCILNHTPNPFGDSKKRSKLIPGHSG